MKYDKPYTVLIRKGKFEYIGICLELNVSARGKTISVVEKNLRNAIDDYLIYVKETKLTPHPISTEDLIEFLRDTFPKRKGKRKEKLFKPIRLQEIPFYA